MKEVLVDVIKQVSSILETVKIVGTDESTIFSGVDDSKNLFIEGKFKTLIPEFKGEFGLTNMKLLNGLLNFSSYQAEGSKFSVKRMPYKDTETVEQFEFRDANKGKAIFRLMNPSVLAEQVKIPKIAWDVQFDPIKSKIAEFAQLANLYSEVEKSFTIKTEDGNLIFCLGSDDSSNHQASLVFQSEITGELNGEATIYEIDKFLTVAKLGANYPLNISIASRGVLAMTISTASADYTYYLRAKRV